MSKQLTEEQLRKEMQRIERDNDVAALRARVAKLEAAVKELLENAGWADMDDDELREEDRLGNGMAEVVLRARAALKDAPQ